MGEDNQPERDPYALALRRLTVREYSSQEMRAYLKRKGFTEEQAASTVARLIDETSLSNERYALAVIRSQAARGKGPAYIRQKLQQKGLNLPQREIQRLFVENTAEEETESILKLVERRYPRAREDEREYRRAFQAMLRRGYSAEAIRKVLGRASFE